MSLRSNSAFLCFLFVFTFVTRANNANTVELSKNIKWHKLVHYQKGLWGSYESLADGKKFFLSPEGKRNPLKEIQATLAAFRGEWSGLAEDHPQCRFPLRFKWLKKHFLDLRSIKTVECKLFERFYKSIDPVGISLVFSSYYMNNPSSVFGHTFLRLHRANKEGAHKRAELLDSGINYAANPTTENPLVYSIYGLIGMFPGTFAKLPYYYKVREYAESESRDLWSYELDLSQEQIDDFVKHLWELGQTHFDYYFLSENCSYHVLAALEAVNPKWDLTGGLPFYVIPSETVKALYRVPNFVKDISYRPSARKIFVDSYSLLSSKDRNLFYKALDVEDPKVIVESSEITHEQRVNAIDSVIDYIDYTKSSELFKEDKEALRFKQKFLLSRAKLGKSTTRIVSEHPMEDAPHLGHPTKYFQVAGGYSQQQKEFVEIGYRFAFHNRLEKITGYPKNISIEVFDAKARSSSENKIPYLEDLNIVRIDSLAPWRSFEYPMAWSLKIGAERIKEDHCSQCLAAMTRFGSGVALDLGLGKLQTFALAEVEAASSLSFVETFIRTGVGPRIGIYRQMHGWWSFSVDSSWKYHWRFPNPWAWSMSVENRVSLSDRWELALRFNREQAGDEGVLSTHVFF